MEETLEFLVLIYKGLRVLERETGLEEVIQALLTEVLSVDIGLYHGDDLLSLLGILRISGFLGLRAFLHFLVNLIDSLLLLDFLFWLLAPSHPSEETS